MDTNWYLKKLLATDRVNTLLAEAEVHRLRRQARRPRWSLRPQRTEAPTLRTAPRLTAPTATADRAAVRVPERPAIRVPEHAAEAPTERAAARRASAVACTPTLRS